MSPPFVWANPNTDIITKLQVYVKYNLNSSTWLKQIQNVF